MASTHSIDKVGSGTWHQPSPWTQKELEHGTDQPHGHSRTWNMALTHFMDTEGTGTWYRPTP